MTCAEFVEKVSAFALSALDDIERQACVRTWRGRDNTVAAGRRWPKRRR